MSALAGPQPISTNPVRRLWWDFQAERHATVPFPPGDTNVSLRRTNGFRVDPLPILLDAYRRHGPVFTQRVFHGNMVFMLGRRRTTTCSSPTPRTSSGARAASAT